MNPSSHEAAVVPPADGPRDNIRTLESSTFTELVLEGEDPVVVEFMSYECGYCRALEPVMQEVAAIVKSDDKIFRVDVAVERELANTYQIGTTPTLVMFLEGREVGRVEGPKPAVSSVLAVMAQAFKA